MSTVVLYHADCADGFGAAFAAWLALGDQAHYIACSYGDPVPPRIEGNDVIIVDFAFERAQMEAIGLRARSLLLLDHHATAAEKLAGFRPACCGRIHFDLQRSGAMLAWDHFHAGKPAPALFRYIQDRDLWLWREPGSEAFLAYLDAQPRSFMAWQEALRMDEEQTERAMLQGAAMVAKVDALCEAIARDAVPVCIDGSAGLMVNAPGALASQIGAMLAKRSGTFGLVWSAAAAGGIKCSLRSGASFDVRRLAEAFGGGGHRAAAGFWLPAQAYAQLAAGRLTSTALHEATAAVQVAA